MPTPISRSLFADLGSFFSLFSTATTAYYSEGYWKEEEDKVEAIERDERLWERERERADLLPLSKLRFCARRAIRTDYREQRKSYKRIEHTSACIWIEARERAYELLLCIEVYRCTWLLYMYAYMLILWECCWSGPTITRVEKFGEDLWRR